MLQQNVLSTALRWRSSERLFGFASYAEKSGKQHSKGVLGRVTGTRDIFCGRIEVNPNVGEPVLRPC